MAQRLSLKLEPPNHGHAQCHTRLELTQEAGVLARRLNPMGASGCASIKSLNALQSELHSL